MPSSSHAAYRECVRNWSVNHSRDADSVAVLNRYAEAAQVLWALDLEAARPILKQGYADNPRGGKPWDPVMLLRALLLSILVKQPSINKWVKDLKASRVLRMLSGIEMDGRCGVPGVGTFYDFMHRLHDGALRRPCEHVQRPSEQQRRRALSAKSRQHVAADDQNAAKTKAGRKALGQKTPAVSKTAQLCSILKETQLQGNANDLLGRLAELLLQVAVKVSAQKGLLGDTAALPISGDGTPLCTGGSRHGQRHCDCEKHTRCDCDRRYSDPDANNGWDSHRERFFYGHRLYEVVASSRKHDLPLALRIDPASTSDYIASLKTIEHLRKSLRDYTDAAIAVAMLDAGHDGETIYRFLCDHNILPIIPLRGNAPAEHPKRKHVRLSPRGVPLCPAGAEMALHATSGKTRVVFACPVKKGLLKSCPHAPDGESRYRCRPLDKLAPTITLNVNDNPRLTPPLPRNHPRFRKLMKLRSGSERSFSVKKQRFALEAARHRRKSFWLIRVHLMAILQHGLAWVAKRDASEFVAQLFDDRLDCAA